MPVDDETSNTAQLQLDSSRGGTTLSPRNGGTVMSHDDNEDKNKSASLEDEPGPARAASQRSLLRRLSYPNRLNYTINAVEAIVENRSQRTETRITALETKIDTLTAMIQTLLDNQQS